jgi:hypothetical protein
MLAPRVSLAHAGHGDERLAFDGGVPGAVFSPSCPANPDHVCGCGNLAGLLRVSEPLAADFPCFSVSASLPAGRTKPLRVEVMAPSLLSLSAACPRAPPQIV